MSHTSDTHAGLFNTQQANAAAASATDISYESLVKEVRNTFDSGKTKQVSWRKEQLSQLRKMFQNHHEEFAAAVRKDLGGPKFRGIFDMGTVAEIPNVIAHLDTWTKPQKVPHSGFIGSSYLRYEPKGVVLLIAPWNYPLAMVLDPLIDIISSGNCAVIKPSEVSENTAEVIARLFPQYLDNDAFKIVTGAVAETTALLREKFDHIFYTGNGAVARIVMAAAAKNLTPVTLELGGKSPVYVDSSAKIELAVARINSIKWLNYGQTCVAADYIMVHKDVSAKFKKCLVEAIQKSYSENVATDVGKVINSRHVERVGKLVSGSKGTVLVGNSDLTTPTVIDEPNMNDDVMKQEIFGPVLPLKEVSGVEEAAELVNKVCKTPLALYVFAENQKVIDYFLDHTQSGGVGVNCALEQLSNHALPFGGVGDSGMGRYHGKWGFDEFSHIRGVYVRTTMLDKQALLPPPPYNQDQMYSLMSKYLITGFISDEQRANLKKVGILSAVVGAALLLKSKM